MSAIAMKAIQMPGLHSLPASVPQQDRVRVDTMLITPDKLNEWPLPGIQRPLLKSKKVREAAEAMQLEAAQDPDEAFCTIKGVVWLGKVGKVTYLADGQHRLYGAFLWASRELLVHGGVLVKQAFVNVGLRHFDSVSDMAMSFIEDNSQLNPTKPDDIMRALARANVHLQAIEEACPFMGYDLTGANKKTKLISMSAAIRTWFGSGGLVPAGGPSALEIVNKFLDKGQADRMIDFYGACVEAGWQHDSFRRLWGALNLGIVMWIWRRTVLGEATRFGSGGQRPMVLTREQFIVCMRTLMEPSYMDDLVGRQLRYQDRVPCYTKIKERFTVGLKTVGIDSPRFPMAQWT